MARYLHERAAREGLNNVEAVLATTDDPRLVEPVDVVLVVDTLGSSRRRSTRPQLHFAIEMVDVSRVTAALRARTRPDTVAR